MEATCVNNSDRKKAPRRHTSASYLTCSSPLSCLSLLYSSFWFQPRFSRFSGGRTPHSSYFSILSPWFITSLLPVSSSSFWSHIVTQTRCSGVWKGWGGTPHSSWNRCCAQIRVSQLPVCSPHFDFTLFSNLLCADQGFPDTQTARQEKTLWPSDIFWSGENKWTFLGSHLQQSATPGDRGQQYSSSVKTWKAMRERGGGLISMRELWRERADI